MKGEEAFLALHSKSKL